MMEYDLILPILLRHKAHPGKALIRELCNVEGVWKAKGYLWCQMCYQIFWPKNTYPTNYGGYHNESEAIALQADKISVVDYVGKSELTVVLEYLDNNPITLKFKREQLKDDYEKEMVDVSKDPALLIGQLVTRGGLAALEAKLKEGVYHAPKN